MSHRSLFTIVSLLVLTLPALAADELPTLDELLNIKPATSPKPARPAPGDAAVPAPDVPAENSANPLATIFTEMRVVSHRLGEKRDPGLETQRLQESILARLDQLIKAAQQSSSSSSSNSSSSSSSSDSQQQQPARQNAASKSSQGNSRQGDQNTGQSTLPDGPGAGDVNEPLQQSRAEWGNLPPRLREELLQGSAERFSPIYRELTEAYYRRLAEEGR